MSTMLYAKSPSCALMEISQLLTKQPTIFIKWPRKLSYLIVGAPLPRSQPQNPTIQVGWYLWVHICGISNTLTCLVYHFFYFPIYVMCRYYLQVHILWDKQYLIGVFSVSFFSHFILRTDVILARANIQKSLKSKKITLKD